MSIEIPEDHRGLLKQWLVDPQDKLEAVLSTLEKAPVMQTPSALAKTLDAVVDGKTATALVGVLGSLVRTALAFGDDVNLTDEIFDSIVAEPEPLEDRRATFAKLISRIRAIPALEVGVKALGVVAEHPRRFVSSRTFSEIRPVFTESDLSPRAAVITHQLRITYEERNDDPIDFFVALDLNDLQQLSRTIARALEKHQKLQLLTQTMGLPGWTDEH